MTSNYSIDGDCLRRRLCKTRIFTIQKVPVQLKTNAKPENLSSSNISRIFTTRLKTKQKYAGPLGQICGKSLCWTLVRLFCVRQLKTSQLDRFLPSIWIFFELKCIRNEHNSHLYI